MLILACYFEGDYTTPIFDIELNYTCLPEVFSFLGGTGS